MTEPAAPAEAGLTPLASTLLRDDPALSLEDRGGRRSIKSFDDSSGGSAGELRALLHSVGLCDLGFRARISVTGEDKFRWLNGMVTNAVATLPEGHGNYNFILNAQGRIQGDAYVSREAERLVIETDHSQKARLLEHFDRFIIMDDVGLADLTETAIGLAGPGAAKLLHRLGIADAADLGSLQFTTATLGSVAVSLVRAYGVLVPHFELWFESSQVANVWKLLQDAGAVPAGLAAQHALRVLEGIPVYGVDIQERNLVQETSQTRALNFAKGCYLGQEIVERIRSRTTVHRFLRQLVLSGDAPEAGSELGSPGEERAAGQLTSIASYRLPGLPSMLALGYVRGEVLDRHLPITYAGGTATVLDAPPAIPDSNAA